MVGMRASQAIPPGFLLLPPNPPLAAALADSCLLSFCSACFTRLVPPPLFPCHGACRGIVSYCSVLCRDSDMAVHWECGECCFLAVVGFAGESPWHASGFVGSSERLGASDGGVSAIDGGWNSETVGAGLSGNDLGVLGGIGRDDGSETEGFFKSCGVSWNDIWQGPKRFPALGGTCDLRTALRLLAYHRLRRDTVRFLESYKLEDVRLGGLMSNRCKLMDSLTRRNESQDLDCTNTVEQGLCMFQTEGEGRNCFQQQCAVLDASENEFRGDGDDDSVQLAKQIREGALLMSIAKRITTELMVMSGETNSCLLQIPVKEESLLAEEVICQVITNGVQIEVESTERKVESGVAAGTRNLGTAVYGPTLSWFNHSCRPNALFSFVLKGSHPYSSWSSDSLVVPDFDITDRMENWGMNEACTELHLDSDTSTGKEFSAMKFSS